MRKNKRGLLALALITSLLFAGIVSAQSCADDDRIMRLYAQTNSHAGLYNDSIYLIDICCSQIFPGGLECINGADNIHTCTGNNKVLRLYNITNSHAELPSLNTPEYNVDVCYRNLKCTAVKSGACPPGSKGIVRLYQDTNSHVSNASTTSYPAQICCKDNTQKAYFADMRGRGYQIDKADIGDTVLMIYEDKVGQSFSFNIKEDDALGDNDIQTVSNTFNYGSDLAAEWVITEEDFKNGGDEELERFYFVVNEIESNRLNVSKSDPDDPDDPNVINELPVVEITIPKYALPKEDRSFKINEDVFFSGYAYDIDNPLNITWELGDGHTKSCIWPKEEDSCIPETVWLNYSSTGTKPVYLRAEELNRAVGRKVSNYTEVYIYESGINLFPVISFPIYGSVFNFTSQPIIFNGSQSYASRCDLTCPAGTSCYPVGDLKCFDYPKTGASGIGKASGQYDLWFNWSFSDGDYVFGNWADKYMNAVDFKKYFFKPQRYKTYLILGFQQASTEITWKGKATTEFDVADTVPVCDRENYVWKKWEGGVLIEWDAISWCYEEDGVPNICCPDGYECGRNLPAEDPNYRKCYQSTSVKEICEDYTEQTECQSAPPEVAARSIARIGDSNFPSGICADDYIEINSSCVRYADCLCKWNADSNNCSAGIDYSGWYCHYDGDDPSKPGEEDGICVLEKSSVEGDCQEDSFLTMRWIRKWVGTSEAIAECAGSFSRTIPCPARLPFFTIASLISAIVIILLIYVIRKKR